MEAPESVILQPETASNTAATSKKVNPGLLERVTKDLVFDIVFFDFSVKRTF